MRESNESRNIVISQDYENFAESAKLQVALLMLAPNFIVTSISETTSRGNSTHVRSLSKRFSPNQRFGFSA